MTQFHNQFHTKDDVACDVLVSKEEVALHSQRWCVVVEVCEKDGILIELVAVDLRNRALSVAVGLDSVMD